MRLRCVNLTLCLHVSIDVVQLWGVAETASHLKSKLKSNAKTMALALAHDSIIHCRGDSSTDVGNKDGDI